MSTRSKPTVLVPACNRMLGAHPFHIVGKKYIDAVRLAGATPLVVPWAAADEIEPLLALADGVLLTGSPSNVHPSRYGAERAAADLLHDEARDEWTLALIPAVLARGIPLLAICRGTQEANVALGGTLHQQVQELKGYADHRAHDADPVELQYGPAHAVQIEPGGILAGLLGSAATIEVNSIHQQAVDRLAPGLRVEARAPDGLIEAFSAPAAPGFNLCVQWHPEWQAAGNPVSMKLLAGFGAACITYQQQRLARAPEFQ